MSIPPLPTPTAPGFIRDDHAGEPLRTGDLLTVSGALPATITTAGYDPGTGVLTLTGTATRWLEYETALTQIR